jgi:hypothetical protein
VLKFSCSESTGRQFPVHDGIVNFLTPESAAIQQVHGFE